MRFESRVDRFFLLVFAGLIVVMLGTIGAVHLVQVGSLLLLIVDITSLLTIGLILWVHFGTYYFLVENEMKFHSGPFKGAISIDSVRKVVVGETQWSGMNRYGTAKKGLIVHYNKFDDLYITPSSNEDFVSELLKLKPTIEVIRSKNTLQEP